VADLNALIAQGAQFNLPNPVDQYSKVMQLQSAQQQMQLNRQQAQQIQEDRAGFAKLRTTLAQKNLTPEDYEIALTQSPDPSHQKLGIEMRFKRIRLADLDKEMGVGVKPAAEAPMAVPVEAPAPMVAPKREMFVTKDSSGRPRYVVDGAEVSPQDYQSMQAGVVTGAAPAARLNAFELPAFEPTNALAAQVAPSAAAPVGNAMLAPSAAAPVGNAMASKQARIAQINKDLATLTKPQYYDLDGVKGRIANLDRELKQLMESPVGKVDLDKFDPASVAKFLDSGNFADLKRIETATGGRYLSLGAGRALDQDTGQIISADKVPVTATAIAGQPQAAPKITTIKGVPYTFDAGTGQFVRVPVEGGLPAAAGRGGAVKPAAAGATDIKPLTETQVIKLRTEVGKDYKNATTALSQIDDLLTSATAVRTAPGLSAATGFTGMLPSFSEGAAAQAETRLANLRGKVTALGKATAAMGGAIGSIANQEWKILADQIAVLNEIKGKGPLLEQIGLLEEQAKGAAARIRDAYEKTRADDFERFPQFRDLPPPKDSGSGALTPAEQAELDQLRSRFGKKKP
jgi:hypothetical protein